MPTLTIAMFKQRTVMPSGDVDLLEAQEPGFLDTQITKATSRVYAQLRMRYAVPFAEPIPEVVLGWIADIVTPLAYRKRGWNPSDEQSAAVEKDRADALAEVAQAATEATGLYDLPLRENTVEGGIAFGAPLFYSEASPYEWTDVQDQALRGR